MYTKRTHSWIKHSDFILLDILCLHIAFVLAYMTRHGFAILYADEDYLSLAAVYTLVDFLVLLANATMKDVLKRGYYKEIERTLVHVFLVTALVSLYMFSVQKGQTYSRITFYLSFGYYLAISYGVRLVWKKILLKKKKELNLFRLDALI